MTHLNTTGQHQEHMPKQFLGLVLYSRSVHETPLYNGQPQYGVVTVTQTTYVPSQVVLSST